MPRTLTAGVITAISADSAEFVHLLEFDFSGGFLRITTGASDLSWNSFTWTAVGGNLEFPGIEETNDTKSQGVRLALSGVDQSLVATLLTNNYRGREVKIWRAHLNTANGTVIADPILMFAGLQLAPYQVEEQQTHDGPNTVKISTTVASFLGVERVRGIQSNLASHQHHFPGDLFFQHTVALGHRQIYWGSIPVTTTGGRNINDPNYEPPPIP